MSGSVSEWVSQWVSEWENELVIEWISEWVNHWVSQWVNQWASWWVSQWVSEWMNDSVSESVSERLIGWLINKLYKLNNASTVFWSFIKILLSDERNKKHFRTNSSNIHRNFMYIVIKKSILKALHLYMFSFEQKKKVSIFFNTYLRVNQRL